MFIFSQNDGGIDTPGALVGGRRKIIPVKDNNFSRFERRLNQSSDMIAAVISEEFQFIFERKAPILRALSQFSSPNSVSGFLAGNEWQSFFLTVFGNSLSQGALPRAIDSLNGE